MLAKSYIPICQSFAPIVFEDLRELVIPPNAKTEVIREKLMRTSEIAREGYNGIKKRKSVLSESVVLMEYLGKMMFL